MPRKPAPRNEPTQPVLRHVLVPISLVLSFALFYWARLPLPGVILVIAPLIVAYVMAPRWARTSLEAFDRDALRLRAAGQHAALRARFDRALGMRFFAAPASVHERRGQILRETGDPAGASRAYRAALLAAGDPAPMPMLLGLGHSAHAAGEDDEAIGAYRRVMEIDPQLPRVRLQLAHAVLRRGRRTDVDDAIALLDGVPTAASDRDEVALLRAYAELRRGRVAAARTAIAEIASPAALRAEIAAALEEEPKGTSKKKKR